VLFPRHGHIRWAAQACAETLHRKRRHQFAADQAHGLEIPVIAVTEHHPVDSVLGVFTQPRDRRLGRLDDRRLAICC
jgi:hypothetical protein